MPKGYSEKFVERLNRLAPVTLELQLAMICVQANISATFVAKAMRVSRMAVHSWFRGDSRMAKSKIKLAETLLHIFKEDFEKGVLPLNNYRMSKEYYRSIMEPK